MRRIVFSRELIPLIIETFNFVRLISLLCGRNFQGYDERLFYQVEVFRDNFFNRQIFSEEVEVLKIFHIYV